MRENFETASSALIEVDPYRRTTRPNARPPAQVSAIDFSSGRGDSGVDLRWHTPTEFKALSSEQKTELSTWQRSPDGK